MSTFDTRSHKGGIPRSLKLLSFSLVLGSGCAATSTSDASRTHSSSHERASSPTAITTTSAPRLTDSLVDADAARPSLIIDPASSWVIVPSLRIALSMPEGWYWADADRVLEDLERTGLALDESVTSGLRRGLQVAANRYPPGHPATAGALIPSVRVVLASGGLPPGGQIPPNLCEQSVLPELRRTVPDARVVWERPLTVAGRRGVRCRLEFTVPRGRRGIPAATESAIVFGPANVAIISSVGAATDPVGEVVDGIVASGREI